jgi:hypothetical protein
MNGIHLAIAAIVFILAGYSLNYLSDKKSKVSGWFRENNKGHEITNVLFIKQNHAEEKSEESEK